ncbi:MAG: CDGSH iron-sulfur domain-containing protein, partial [Pseudomonadota bacterium]
MTELPKITPAQDGPLIVENPPKLSGAYNVDVAGQPKVALCRCGASANKPFCDGAHVQQAFSSKPDRERLRNTPIDSTGDVNGVVVTISYT